MNRRTWRQRLVLSIAVLATLGCFIAAAGLWFVSRKVDRIQRVQVSQVLAGGEQASIPTTAADQPVPGDDRAINILLVGVDSAAGLAADDPRRTQREDASVEGLRSDTIIVIRLEPATGQVAMVSFPRDLWVTVGDGEDRINGAMLAGGPVELIRTITNNFGIPIDHYIQVDFAQFQSLVEAVGGVPISIDRPLRDTHSGLWLPDPGCITLTPVEALAYTRARNLEYLDGDEWVIDPSADLGRVSRQQEFLLAALNRAIDRGARNPVTLNRLIDTGIESVVLDDAFGVGELAGLAYRFRSFDTSKLERYTLAVYDDEVGGAAVLRLIEDESGPVLDIFRGVPPPVVPPSEVTVVLHDGGLGGVAVTEVAATLSQFGFAVQIGDDVEPARTELQFALSARGAAETLARHLDAPLGFAVGDAGQPHLVVGADFGGVRDTPRPPGPRLALSTRRTGLVPSGAGGC